MKTGITLWIISILLASCVAPEKKPSVPYTETGIVQIVEHNEHGGIRKVYVPVNGTVTIDPRSDTIKFFDEDGKPVELDPSYTIMTK